MEMRGSAEDTNIILSLLELSPFFIYLLVPRKHSGPLNLFR